MEQKSTPPQILGTNIPNLDNFHLKGFLGYNNCRVPKGVLKGGGNWGTLRIPREDWGTLGNIRED